MSKSIGAALDEYLAAQSARIDALTLRVQTLEQGDPVVTPPADPLPVDQPPVDPPPVGEIDGGGDVSTEPPPPPVFADKLVFTPIPLTGLLLFTTHHKESRYERGQNAITLTGVTAAIHFHKFDFPSGGTRLPLAGTYRLLVNGEERAQAVVADGLKVGTFTLDLVPLPDLTWLRLEVIGDGTTVPWTVFLNRDGVQIENPPPAPVVAGSFDWTKHAPAHFFGTIPPQFRPTEQPLTPRECPPVTIADKQSDLVRTNVAIEHGANIRRLVRNEYGAVSTFNKQAYFWSDLVASTPRLPLLDGPRGRGTITMPTHVMLGRNDKFYVCEPWRLVRVHADGYIHTLAGWRHRQEGDTPASGWGSSSDLQQPDLEFIGTWDESVSVDRRRFHEIWGNAWWQRSLEIDESAAELPPEPGHSDVWQKPHKIGVRAFLSDSQMDRVVALDFSPVIHGAPVISEFWHGPDCWDVVATGLDTIAISERKANRIVEVNAATGELVRVLVQGPEYGALAVVAKTRFINRLVSVDVCRTVPCLLPEGLAVMDDWLYWGSAAQAEVRRLNLRTGEIQLVCRAPVEHYIKLAVSDGTFYPRHSVFTTAWIKSSFGYPTAFVPQDDGTWRKWNIVQVADFPAPNVGRAKVWSGLSYDAAVGVGRGRLVCGSACEGLVMLSKALPSDPVIDVAKYRAGRAEYEQWAPTHGDDGFGFAGLALPFGVSEAMDYYLAAHGHVAG